MLWAADAPVSYQADYALFFSTVALANVVFVALFVGAMLAETNAAWHLWMSCLAGVWFVSGVIVPAVFIVALPGKNLHGKAWTVIVPTVLFFLAAIVVTHARMDERNREARRRRIMGRD